MFGNYDEVFGIPAFPLEGMDPQGGLFGVNTPGTSPGTSSHSAGLNLPGGGQPAGTPPAAGIGGAPAPAQPALGAPSALGGGVLAPGAGLTGRDPTTSPFGNEVPTTAPAAGVGSPLGRVGV